MTAPGFSIEEMHDLLRGIAQYAQSPLVGDLAEAAAAHPDAPFSVAFNPKQIRSKAWLIDELLKALGGNFDEVTIVGGWIGVLSGMLLNDARLSIRRIESYDIDPDCAPVALALNRRFVAEGRFAAHTGDMHALRLPEPDGGRRLLVNTSAEHIPDPGLWARSLPPGLDLAVQSNDYRAVPEHVSCVDSAEELAQRLGLREVAFLGALKERRYTRFMAIGRL